MTLPEVQTAPLIDDAAPERPTFGLSARLLALTVLFVMLSEILIFVPSIANFREGWLRDRIGSADVAVLLLDAYPDGMVPSDIEQELLQRLDARMIAYRADGMRFLLASSGMPEAAAIRQDLRGTSAAEAVRRAFATLVTSEPRLLHILDDVKGGTLELIVEETDLRADMLGYAWNILLLSLAISGFTAAAVYASLRWLLIRPMQRLTRAMAAFRDAPGAPGAVISPSSRTDEVGVAERELAVMQHALRRTLSEQARLAALGLAVAKINHDLRNMLASAQLFIERLESVPDPTVQRLAPKLVQALDRAIGFTRDTMQYGSAQEREPQIETRPLRPMLDAAAEAVGLLEADTLIWQNDVAPGLDVDADPDQLFRITLNLLRNASQALRSDGGRIVATAHEADDRTVIELADDGPGVPEGVRAKLFQPFATSGRGGTGLGLVIVDELVRAHGGTVALGDAPGGGAVFRITLPRRPGRA